MSDHSLTGRIPVAALVLGPRHGWGRDNMAPHNLAFTAIGTGLLFVGWMGFNGGSAAGANEIAAVAVVCLFVAWAEGPVTVAVTLVFVVLVWVFAGEEGRVSRLLDHPALVTLGRWSFSIYMVHMFILTVMLIIARKLDWMPGGRRVDFGSVWLNDLFALSLFGFIVVVAVLAHNRVERPAQRLPSLDERWPRPSPHPIQPSAIAPHTAPAPASAAAAYPGQRRDPRAAQGPVLRQWRGAVGQ